MKKEQFYRKILFKYKYEINVFSKKNELKLIIFFLNKNKLVQNYFLAHLKTFFYKFFNNISSKAYIFLDPARLD